MHFYICTHRLMQLSSEKLFLVVHYHVHYRRPQLINIQKIRVYGVLKWTSEQTQGARIIKVYFKSQR